MKFHYCGMIINYISKCGQIFFIPFWVANSFVERRTCLIKLPCSWSGFVAQLVEEVLMQLESGWRISLNPVEVKFFRLLLCNCFHCRFLRKTVSLVVYFAYDQWVRILLFYLFPFSTVNKIGVYFTWHCTSGNYVPKFWCLWAIFHTEKENILLN